jgi:N-acetylneuraminate synthase/N,N'-diacetyllegionaminate synthase
MVVAEVGVNHEGKTDDAKRLIELTARMGIGSIKFQTYSAEKIVTPSAMKYWHLSPFDKPTDRQIDTFKKLDGLPTESYKDLVEYGEELGVIVFSTPFDEESVDILYRAGVAAFKIASGDITYHRLLKKVGESGLPIILSVGASNEAEISDAIEVIKSTKNEQIILLHCVLDYPAEEKDANLKVIEDLKRRYNLPIGFSDHTIGFTAPLFAVKLGACLIEKHCTDKKYNENIDKDPLSPDHCFLSMEEIGELATKIENLEKGHEIDDMAEDDNKIMLGTDNPPRPLECEKAAHIGARRSIVAKVDIEKGDTISEHNIIELRPGTGLAPTFKNISKILGKKTIRSINKNDFITLDLL